MTLDFHREDITDLLLYLMKTCPKVEHLRIVCPSGNVGAELSELLPTLLNTLPLKSFHLEGFSKVSDRVTLLGVNNLSKLRSFSFRPRCDYPTSIIPIFAFNLTHLDLSNKIPFFGLKNRELQTVIEHMVTD